MSQLNTQITFTDEQALLLETATEFCRDKSPIPAVRTLLTSQHGFNPTVWNDMVALGWSAIAIPERHGGSGLSLAEVATLAEPMGRHLLATPYASTQIAVQALLAGASPPMQATILPRIAQGAIATTADILIGLERTRSHLYHAATICAGNENPEIALRMAKTEAGDTFTFAADRAIQFHGGFGFTYECDAQLYLRRALWLQYNFGDATHHRRKLADLLL